MNRISKWISVAPVARGCNLACEYCYVSHHTYMALKDEKEYSVECIKKALTIERMSGICMFNLCANGETLLCKDIFEIIQALLENGHYVSIVTNGTVTKIINEILNLEQYLDRVVFKCSLHYEELKKRDMLDVFAQNVKAMKQKGVAFTVECVACDTLLDDIDEIKKFCMDNFGALPHLLTGRSEYTEGKFLRFGSRLSDEEYYKVWSEFNSDLFEYQYKDFELDCRGYFCHGGEFTGVLNLGNGNFIPCPGNGLLVTNFFEDLQDVIHFTPMARSCPLDSCFMGHVFNGLGGDYIAEHDAGYRFWQFRDRKCGDGSHWLSDTIREVYSHQCCECYQEPDECKKNYLTALLKIRYKQDLNPEVLSVSETVREKLQERGIYSVAIYGMGNIGKWLYRLLTTADMEVKCGIDQQADNISFPLTTYFPKEMQERVDVIIVSTYDQISSIRPLLNQYYPDVPVISASELI